jgi:hypothetical protein
MRRTTINKWWLTSNKAILGFDEGSEGAGAGAEGTQGGAEGGTGSGAEGAEGAEGANSQTDDAAGLKSALQKERTERRAMEKELKAFRAAQTAKDDAEKTEVQRLTDQQTQASQRLQKLADGYRNNAVEAAILRAATEAKFRDPSDALRAEVLSAIGVEQDQDDPTAITIDSATVKDAVKALAKSKPHYLQAPAGAQGTGAPSGSKFGGGSNSGGKPDQNAALLKAYPALRGRISSN